MKDKIVEVIGTGYVGLPLALLLAKNGIKVIACDINQEVVDNLNNQVLTIGEEAIDELIKDPVVQSNIHATAIPEKADIFVVAVPTPVEKKKKIADLAYVTDAVHSITNLLEKGNLLIIESTIPPLTCRDVVRPLIEKETSLKINEDIFLAHCPERILPGDIYNEIINNARIVGGMNEIASKMAKELYEVFVKGEIIITDDITAELCKLTENAYRDVNIAFANEVYQVAEGLGINPFNLIEIANKHPRVNILKPGIGVGGHCIAVDPWFIKEADNKNTSLIQTARIINDNRPELMASKIRKLFSLHKKGKKKPRLVLLGATYKPNTADIRESPALRIYNILVKEGYNPIIKDPLIQDYSYNHLTETIQQDDIIFVLVKHDKILSELDSLTKENPDIPVFYLP